MDGAENLTSEILGRLDVEMTLNRIVLTVPKEDSTRSDCGSYLRRPRFYLLWPCASDQLRVLVGDCLYPLESWHLQLHFRVHM